MLNKSKRKKAKAPIIAETADLESIVIDSVNRLMDEGVLAESDDGLKIDLKTNIEQKKGKKRGKRKRK